MKRLLLFCAVCALAGCAPSGLSGAAPIAHSARPSWMASDAAKGALLYISNAQNGLVYAYSYPAGTLEGTLTGFKEPYGLCADKDGEVWIVDDETALVTEYAHGGTTPIATLSDSNEYPAGCSVDPATGNLAVTNYEDGTGGQGSVAIYKNAKGKPKLYTDSRIARAWFCGYGEKSNLYVDGTEDGSQGFQMAELSRSGAFTNISLNQDIFVAGGVQWDGKYLAVAEENNSGPIYEFSVSGSSGTEVGSTSLTGSANIHQFWIDPKRNRIVAPSASRGTVGFWKFPAGGYAKKTIVGLGVPEGVALSNVP